MVGIIISEKNSLVSLVNKDGETINLAMFEELNEGVKLVDMNDSGCVEQKQEENPL